MSNSAVLVTGGAEFLGPHLCSRLLENAFEIVCVDNLYMGRKSDIYDLARRFANKVFLLCRRFNRWINRVEVYGIMGAGPINLGNPIACSMLDLAANIKSSDEI